MKNILYSIVLLFCLVVSVVAQVPRVISYQGVLVGADGKPVDGRKILTFTIVNDNSQPHSSGFTHTQEFLLQGGLFFAELGNLHYSNIPFPTLEGQWYLLITDEISTFKLIPLYSTVSALNIADNVVTSAKIKDGEVGLQDLKPGSTVGEILKWDGTQWTRSQDEGLRTVSVTSPLSGNGTPADPIKVDIPSSVPVGTIVAFYGLTSQVHPDWLVCNGDYVNQSSYPALFNHLNTLYGSSKLPDLRGMFLRGADLGIGNDPDTAISTSNGRRWPIGIGDNTERIGSLQPDAFQGHWHQHQYENRSPWNGFGTGGNGWQHNYALDFRGATSQGMVTNPISDGFQTVGPSGLPRTSSETRPKNVYVNYIIKAR